VHDVRLSPSGRLLAWSLARYDTLDEYLAQFGPPTSCLPGAGLWTFHDPIIPDMTLLVHTVHREICHQCGQLPDDCACPF
jgi:hypothetical protein